MCGRDIELNQAGMAALAEVSPCCTKLWEWNFWVSCYLTIVMQGTDLCNVFMCSNIPGCWGGAGSVCLYSQGWELISRKEGSLPLLTSKLVVFGHRTAHRKFMFAKTAPWGFPVLPAWPLLHPCSTLTSSLFCKTTIVFRWILFCIIVLFYWTA